MTVSCGQPPCLAQGAEPRGGHSFPGSPVQQGAEGNGTLWTAACDGVSVCLWTHASVAVLLVEMVEENQIASI